MLTPVSMELRTPPLELKIPRAVATTVWPSSSSSSSSRALGLGDRYLYCHTHFQQNTLDLYSSLVSLRQVTELHYYLTGMALGTALMLLCWCLVRWSTVRVKVSKPLSWSVFWGCGGICGFTGLELRPCSKHKRVQCYI